MKTSTIPLLLALLASAALAQQPEDRRPPQGPPHGPPLLAVIDTDHDGIISTEEIQSAAQVLESLDKNHDGQITEDELRPPGPAGGPPPGPPNGMFPHPPPPVIDALDVDHDGTLSAEELDGAPESLKSLDKDGNGELSPEELRPQGPPPPPFGEGNGRKPRQPGPPHGKKRP